MKLGNRRRLMLRVGFFVAIVIFVKLVIHRLDWEFITVSPLFSGIVAANIFLMGFLLSGVLSDYKESERLPGELSAGLQNLMQEITAMGMAKPGSDVTPCLRQVTGLGAYLLLFYAQLATRPGQPTTMDIVTATVGIVLLLEATRRAVGWPMAALAAVFIFYAMAGPWMPEVLQHKGASLNRLISHMWLTTEGVYGIALGVSTGAIFVYVLFGALLYKAGGGNYMMQVSFAALGHLRGGPAKPQRG